MGYIESNLMKDEQLVYRANIHWMIFLWPMIWTVLGIWIVFMGTQSSPEAGDSLIGVGMGTIILLALPSWLSAVIYKLTTEFGVTSKRIIAKTGLIRRRSVDLLISKLESVQVDQGILERILGAGKVEVRGTGGSKEPFKRISKPLELRKAVQTQQG